MAEDDGTVEVYPGAERPVAVPAEIVLEASREYRAYLAHQQGKNWAEIAVQENYATPTAARESVRRYLAEGRVLAQDYTKAEMLALEIATINKMQASIWDAAVAGKLPAVAMVLNCVGMRMKYLRLDEDNDMADQARTVVVHAEDGAYLATLERVASS